MEGKVTFADRKATTGWTLKIRESCLMNINKMILHIGSKSKHASLYFTLTQAIIYKRNNVVCQKFRDSAKMTAPLT